MDYSGRCLCGQVTYKATGAPLVVAQCHCEECRRLSGTGHSIGAMFAASAVTLTGELATYHYQGASGAEVTRSFCARCGSPIHGRNSAMPDHLTLTLGTLDAAPDLAVQAVIFDRDRPHWDHFSDQVPVFATQPDWTPGAG